MTTRDILTIYIPILISFLTALAALIESFVSIRTLHRIERTENTATIVFQHQPRMASDMHPHILITNTGHCTATDINIRANVNLNLQATHIDQLFPGQPVRLSYTAFGFRQVLFTFSYTDRLGFHPDNTYTMLVNY